MRALLVVNPHATSTTPAGLDVLAAALSSEVKLDVAVTTHRGHAAELAAQAVRDRFDLVVAHGGDGTVNEVVNGLLAGGGPTARTELPALGVVPGGSANVFGATLGVSRNPVDATANLLHALRERRRRTISLGRVLAFDPQHRPAWPQPRWFTFNAGLGMDAVAVRSVERARARGKRASTPRYIHAALLAYFEQHRDPHLTVELPAEEPISGVYLAIVANSDPYTYAGGWAVRMHHGHGLDHGLGLFALRTMALLPVLRHVRQILRRRGAPRGRRLVRRQDLPALAVSSTAPIELQVDGDYVGRHVRAEFESVPDALTVIA